MILQISTSDVQDSWWSNISTGSDTSAIIYLIAFIFFGVIILLLTNHRKKKRVHKVITSPSKKPFSQTKITNGTSNNTSWYSGTKTNTKKQPSISSNTPLRIEGLVETRKGVLEAAYPESIQAKILKNIKSEKEEYSRVKYIGYKPLNIFAQTEPLHYPYVLMPKPNTVIKFPRKGRTGRKGYKEEEFKQYIERYFKRDYQIFDDRFILVKNSSKPYEPDITLIDEKAGINIFLDVEIDEPYEGINNISRRKPTHYQYSDTNRNNAFKNRGWIVIRFAEIQVHQNPKACCRFIATVLQSINPRYIMPSELAKFDKVDPVRQWTRLQAQAWSKEKYRERYLGIVRFGQTVGDENIIGIEETDIGEKIEELVEDDLFQPIEIETNIPRSKIESVYSAINSNKYLSFGYDKEITIVKPLGISGDELLAFCYVKNRERSFLIKDISNLQIKTSYYTLRVSSPTIGLDQIKNAVRTAIDHQKYIRMKYTRSAWTNTRVDTETGELMIDKIEAEESTRTINNVQLSLDVLSQEHIDYYRLDANYITAYCNRREEKRTFRFDRIGEIELLDL